MTCTRAPACKAVLDQATALWPNRSTASDGICASATHTSQNPGSDHEPHVIVGGVAYATAVDLTDDKAGGCDADAWAEQLRLRQDNRIKYVICNRRMFSSYATSISPAWAWRPYTGDNPHEKHTHLSIVPAAIFDTRPWFTGGDDVTEEEHNMLATANHFVKVIWPHEQERLGRMEAALEQLTKGAPGFGIDPPPIATDKILELVERIAEKHGIDVETG